MRRFMLAGIAAAAMLSSANFASAAVKYEFTSTAPDVTPYSDFGTVTGAWSFTTPGFVTANLDLPTSSLSSCSVTSTAGPVHCLDQPLYPSAYGGHNTVELGMGDVHGDSLGVFYLFAPDAFTTYGVHETDVPGYPQGQLTVLNIAGVPEPSVWALMILGLGLAGASLRRRPALAVA